MAACRVLDAQSVSAAIDAEGRRQPSALTTLGSLEVTLNTTQGTVAFFS